MFGGGFGANNNSNPGAANPFASTFGAPSAPGGTASANAFGTSSSFGTQSTSGFGAPSTASTSAPMSGGGGFGQSVNGPMAASFGGIGRNAASVPAFGTVSSMSQGFGSNATANSTGFGTQNTTTNPFGSTTNSAFGTASQPSAFGGNTQNTFGSTSAQPTTTFGSTNQVSASPFGGTQQTATTTAVGSTSQPQSTTAFGASTQSTPAFGSGAHSTTAFGTSTHPQSATRFGTSNNQQFGQPSTAAFGTSQPFSAPASRTPFGSTAFSSSQQTTTTTTTFGNMPASQPTTTFGGSNPQSSSTPAFGSKPLTTFGTNQPSTLGGSSDTKTKFGGFGGGANQETSAPPGDAAKNPFAAAAAATTGGASSGAFGAKQPSSPGFGRTRNRDSGPSTTSGPVNPFAAAAVGGSSSGGTNSPSSKTAFGQPSTFGGSQASKPAFGGNTKKFGSRPPTPPLPDEMPKLIMRVKPPAVANPFAAAAANAASGGLGSAVVDAQAKTAPTRGRSPMRGGRMGQRMMRKSPSPSPEREDSAAPSGSSLLAASTEKAALETATNLDGSCVDMCSASERELHIRVDELSVFEKCFPDQPGQERNLIIKRFQRSSADHKLDIPEEIRPPGVLRQTQLYLETQIMDRERLGLDPRFNPPRVPELIELYNFCWDRMRMIRKDFVLQNYRGAGGRVHPIALDVHERIARYHIFSEHELCEEKNFVAQQNMEQLGQTLKSLNELYDESHKVGDPAFRSPFEAEFRAYFILCTLDNGRGLDVLKFVKGLAKPIRESPQVKFAMKAFVARHTNDYFAFFRLVRESTLLQACLLFRYMTSMRSNALQRMNRAFRKQPFALQEITELLCFDDLEHARSVCSHHGLRLQSKPSGMDDESNENGDEQEFILFGGGFESDIQLRRNKNPLAVQGAWAYVLPKQGGCLRRDICRGVTEYAEDEYPCLSKLIEATEAEEFQRLRVTRLPTEDEYSRFADFGQVPPHFEQSAQPPALTSMGAGPPLSAGDPQESAKEEAKRKQLEEIMKRKAEIELKQKQAKERLERLEQERQQQAKAKQLQQEQEEQAKAKAKMEMERKLRERTQAEAQAKAQEEARARKAKEEAEAKAQAAARLKQQIEEQQRRKAEEEANRRRLEEEKARAREKAKALAEAQAKEEARRRQEALQAEEEARKRRQLAEAEAKRRREEQIREEKMRKAQARKRKQVLAVLQLRFHLWRKYSQTSRGFASSKPIQVHATQITLDPSTRAPGQVLRWLFSNGATKKLNQCSRARNGMTPLVYDAQDIKRFGSWTSLNVPALVIASTGHNSNSKKVNKTRAEALGFKLVVADLMSSHGSCVGNWCACKLGIRSLPLDQSVARFHSVSTEHTREGRKLSVCIRYLDGDFGSCLTRDQQKRKLLGTNAIILPVVLADINGLVAWRQRVRFLLSCLPRNARVAMCVLAYCHEETSVEAEQLQQVEKCLRELYDEFASQIVRVDCELVFANDSEIQQSHQIMQMVQSLAQHAPPYRALVGVGLRELLEDALLMVVKQPGITMTCSELQQQLTSVFNDLRGGLLEHKWLYRDFPAPELENQLVTPPPEWNTPQYVKQMEVILSLLCNATLPNVSAVEKLALNWSNCCDFVFAKLQKWIDRLLAQQSSPSRERLKRHIHNELVGLHSLLAAKEAAGVAFSVQRMDQLFPWRLVFEAVYTALFDSVSEDQVVYVEVPWLEDWQTRLAEAKPALTNGNAMEPANSSNGVLNGTGLVSETSLKRSFGILTIAGSATASSKMNKGTSPDVVASWKPVTGCESAQLKRLKREISLGHREAQAFQAYLHQQLSKWDTSMSVE